MSDKDSYAMGFGFLCLVGWLFGWMSLFTVNLFGAFWFLVPPLCAVGWASGLGGVIRS
jgi:hypothetical protein